MLAVARADKHPHHLKPRLSTCQPMAETDVGNSTDASRAFVSRRHARMHPYTVRVSVVRVSWICLPLDDCRT
jgi:hypothetical protein